MRTWFKRLFIPHKGNDFRPDFLERLSVGIMLVLVLLSFAMANIQALLWIGSDWLVSTILPSVIIELTNEERVSEDLRHLVRNATLDHAAKLKAEDMAENGYFAHYSPTGVSPWYWFDEAGYDYLHAGENLAVHFTESDEVVEAWMNSPLHRDNIMNGRYAEIGVGTARGEYNGFPTIFVVQLFGTQRERVTPNVRGVRADSNDITVEKLALPATTSDVAPATLETQAPSEDVLDGPEEANEPLDSAVPPVAEASTSESVMMSSGLATSSREGVPATVAPYERSGGEVTPPLKSATAPSMWLGFIYGLLALSVIASLITSLVLEWRRHHPIQLAYASGLLTIMALLLYIHMSLTGSVVIM